MCCDNCGNSDCGGGTADEQNEQRSCDMVTNDQAELAVEMLLRNIESLRDSESLRGGIEETPQRVVKSYRELFAGYHQDPAEHLKLFECGDTPTTVSTSADVVQRPAGMILVKNIEFQSTCEHHMLPFIGKAHVAYIPGPDGRVLGVSKLARLVDVFAKRLQIQERIGEQVVDSIYNGVPGCVGAACVIDSKHLCMSCRGVAKQHSSMVTSALRGVFYEHEVRSELMSLIGV